MDYGEIRREYGFCSLFWGHPIKIDAKYGGNRLKSTNYGENIAVREWTMNLESAARTIVEF